MYISSEWRGLENIVFFDMIRSFIETSFALLLNLHCDSFFFDIKTKEQNSFFILYVDFYNIYSWLFS